MVFTEDEAARLFERIFAFLRKNGDRDAEDHAEDTLLKLIEKYSNKPMDELERIAFTIAKRLLIRSRRRGRRYLCSSQLDLGANAEVPEAINEVSHDERVRAVRAEFDKFRDHLASKDRALVKAADGFAAWIRVGAPDGKKEEFMKRYGAQRGDYLRVRDEFKKWLARRSSNDDDS